MLVNSLPVIGPFDEVILGMAAILRLPSAKNINPVRTLTLYNLSCFLPAGLAWSLAGRKCFVDSW